MHLHATHEGDVARYAYFKQTINGISVANAVANVALNKANKLVAIGSSFVQNLKANSAAPSISIHQAIATAESALNGTFEAINFPQPKLIYLVKGDSSLALAHVFQVRNGGSGSWYEAYVDAHTGEILSVTDFVAQATYLVLPITKQILTQGFEDLVDPYDIEASPLGWHNDGKTLSNDTAGNNAISFNIIQADVVTESASNLTFLFTQDPTLDPTVTVNLDAARVNAFYLVNSVHDIAYRYGFTESAFNFQTDNFGLGGKGNDRITISVQDGGGVNNAEFTTLPDGQNGQMRMFIWDYTVPRRDSDLENDIVVHEYTHGITNRMTGGGTATCLQTLEAGGLGEGWSDAMAEWSEHTDANITDYVIGPYVTNNTAGLRTYPYSTSNVTNPLRYSSVAKFNEVHQIGEVWANMLHNIYAALIQQHGFSQTAHTDPT
ncbi:hypothetical protein PHLCEN_2v3275 [Hermanssonia centrifuga]|uniref:Extracellular metalloproteinase n=1 Tax=Hermanssonia centrifuga TaxID=98765 RepID=A0A2R6QUI9_9APHY|nr:hypothetical protein PHLCEN_2v3275 [Hermanssonia centrifuga]